MSHSRPFRTLALVLAVVMLVLVATPARAEAIEPLTMVALVSLAIAGVILIAFLIIANVEDRKSAEEPAVIWVAQSPES
jgi:hypothetical protein